MKKAASIAGVLLLAAASACTAPPVSSEGGPGGAAPVGSASDAAATSSEAPPRKADPAAPGLAAAKALADAGEHDSASVAYEEAYRYSPRGKLAEEALHGAAEEAFQAGKYYRALELFDKLLLLYPTTSHYPEVVRRQFQLGKLYVEEKAKKPSWFIGVDKTDAAYGIEVLERFVKARDQHELAPEALYLVGEAHLRADEPELAIESWQRLVRDYPRTSWARLGEYRIALAFISLSYGVEYDKRPLITGRKRLSSYVRKYPTGDNFQEAKQRLAELEETLAQHELSIAKGYARRGKYRAAHIYLLGILREYPESKTAKVDVKRLQQEWENPPDPPAPEDPK